MWETQSIVLCSGWGMSVFEHDEHKFAAYRAKWQINQMVQDWRLGKRKYNPATTYNIDWLENHFHPSNF